MIHGFAYGHIADLWKPRHGVPLVAQPGHPAKKNLLIRDTPHVRLYVLNMSRMRGSRL